VEPKSNEISRQGLRRHSRENVNPEAFEMPGFRVALAIASLPGMTIKLRREVQL
jgi:hypothetical protein